MSMTGELLKYLHSFAIFGDCIDNIITNYP